MDSSPPPSPPSSAGSFDWREFLIDYTNEPGDATVMPDHTQVEQSHKEVNLSPTSERLPKKRKRKEYSEASKEERKIAARIRSKRYRASQKIKRLNGEINIQKIQKGQNRIGKERARAYAKRYRERKKSTIGFTSISHARLYQLRHLEKNNQLTPEQEKKLFDHRANNNRRTQEWRAKEKLKQKEEKAS